LRKGRALPVPIFVIVKMKRLLFIISLFLLLPSSVLSESGGSLKLLFFFSASCPHCGAVMPVVIEMSKDCPVYGFIYGKEPAPELPFPVEKGTEELIKRYNIQGLPSLVILEGERLRTVITGESAIKDSPFVLKALRSGALTVSEALSSSDDEILLIGWLIHRGNYFKGEGFFITDKQKEIPVKPWLPLEAIKSPFNKKRPTVMSDFINKPVVLKGRVLKKDDGYILHVKEVVEWKD